MYCSKKRDLCDGVSQVLFRLLYIVHFYIIFLYNLFFFFPKILRFPRESHHKIVQVLQGTTKTSTRSLDLPQVDCERASENEGRSRATRAKVARRVDLFRLRNIEFNLHIVGAKKPQEQSTGCTGLSYSKSTS